MSSVFAALEHKVLSRTHRYSGDLTTCELTLTDGRTVFGSFTAPNPDIMGAYDKYERNRRSYQDALCKI